MNAVQLHLKARRPPGGTGPSSIRDSPPGDRVLLRASRPLRSGLADCRIAGFLFRPMRFNQGAAGVSAESRKGRAGFVQFQPRLNTPTRMEWGWAVTGPRPAPGVRATISRTAERPGRATIRSPRDTAPHGNPRAGNQSRRLTRQRVILLQSRGLLHIRHNPEIFSSSPRSFDVHESSSQRNCPE